MHAFILIKLNVTVTEMRHFVKEHTHTHTHTEYKM